jgi:hypothetical protein
VEEVNTVKTHDNFTEKDAREVEVYYKRIETAYAWALLDAAWWDTAAHYAGALYDAEQARLAAEAAAQAQASYSQPASYGSSGTSWDAVAQCESGGNWSINTGNGYYGGLQFDSGTWDTYGNPTYGEANEAPMSEQIAAAERMPYDGWPNC